MVDIHWDAIAIGGGAVLFGLVLIVFRGPIARFIIHEQRETFGKLGEWNTRKAKPSHLIAPGVFGIMLGLLIIVLTIVLPPYHGS